MNVKEYKGFFSSVIDEFNLAIVKQDGRAIEFIDNPSKQVQLIAVKQNAFAIKYIIKKGIIPSEKVQLIAVKQNGLAITFIKNPTEKVKQLHQELWGNR